MTTTMVHDNQRRNSIITSLVATVLAASLLLFLFASNNTSQLSSFTTLRNNNNSIEAEAEPNNHYRRQLQQDLRDPRTVAPRLPQSLQVPSETAMFAIQQQQQLAPLEEDPPATFSFRVDPKEKNCIDPKEVEGMANALKELYEKHGVRAFPRNGFLLGIIRHGGFLPNEKVPDADLGIISTDVDRMTVAEGTWVRNEIIKFGEYKLVRYPVEEDWVSWKGRDPRTGEQYPFFRVRINRRPFFSGRAQSVYPYGHDSGKFFFPRLNLARYNHESHTREMLRYNDEGANYRLLDTDELLSQDNNEDGLQIGTVFDSTFECMVLKQFYFTTIYVPCDYEEILEAFYGKSWNHVENRGGGGKGNRPAMKLSDKEHQKSLQGGPKPLCA
mmetsp:Transcript_41027/g.73977  ORF Transcript_41027/g.73977 Transcript_41027/m.73977 type:complete len:385 (+) Transcript_41027:32-1186(+)